MSEAFNPPTSPHPLDAYPLDARPIDGSPAPESSATAPKYAHKDLNNFNGVEQVELANGGSILYLEKPDGSRGQPIGGDDVMKQWGYDGYIQGSRPDKMVDPHFEYQLPTDLEGSAQQQERALTEDEIEVMRSLRRQRRIEEEIARFALRGSEIAEAALEARTAPIRVTKVDKPRKRKLHRIDGRRRKVSPKHIHPHVASGKVNIHELASEHLEEKAAEEGGAAVYVLDPDAGVQHTRRGKKHTNGDKRAKSYRSSRIALRHENRRHRLQRRVHASSYGTGYKQRTKNRAHRKAWPIRTTRHMVSRYEPELEKDPDKRKSPPPPRTVGIGR